ncbi:MAG: DEAD/DEAH box helicase family protein [Anaerolineae bacterium]
MPAKLQLKFDANQEHQLQAVESIVRLFEGMTRYDAGFQLGDEIVANLPRYEDLAETWLRDNLHAVQEKNGLPQSMLLDWDTGIGLEGIADESHRFPHFTIEMETGTGKTYVYLRAIFELRRRFGWSKFVIVVPGIAIYEGVMKNVQVTRNHFRALYGNEPFDLIAYDGSQLSRLRHFATANTTTVLLITLDAFNKASNNLYKASEKLPGERRPFQFIQETRPILILDEPQNMESEKAKQALRTLKPILALRFSATHRTSPNLVYRLTPFDAYARSLVKRIEVYGVTERDNANIAFLALTEITPPPRITAKVRTRVSDRGGTREAEVVLHQGDDLKQKTGRPEHDGFVVENIDLGAGYVEFRNGERLYLLAGMAPSRPAVFREQIRQTILRHMRWQAEVASHDVKVLSLFFIDRVANYTASDGLIRRLFDEEFERLKDDYGAFKHLTAAQVRQAYFAKKKQKDGREEDVDTESRNAGEREMEKQAFALIMRDKERLLSFDEPVSFIFAHSALKEGWDNPNVFQICTLNQTVSEIKKRQEIGRGLRLAVNQVGERVHDEEVNVLTVVANESYQNYVGRLQSEYVADGDAPPPAPTNAHLKRDAIRNDRIFFQNEHFEAFWGKLNQRLRYRMHIETPALIEACVMRLNRQTFPGHVLVVERGKVTLGAFRINVKRVTANKAEVTLSLFDAEGEPETITRTFKPGADIARETHNEHLRNLGTLAIEPDGSAYRVIFTNVSWRLAEGEEVEYTPVGFGGRVAVREVQVRADRYPVFNLMDRAVKQTGLTRPTINAIFRRMRDDQKQRLLENPEGFATVFIGEVRSALADHVTARLEFLPDEGAPPYDLGEIFPPKRSFPQKELLEAGPRGLYNLVQKDSDVEKHYVDAIRQEGDAIVFYFKFPPGFKVHLPAIIGNYNPDWGVARVDRAGRTEVRTFVHETKGTTELSKLQFPNERRKILCAQKFFAVIGVTYLTIDPKKVSGWWEPVTEQSQIE